MSLKSPAGAVSPPCLHTFCGHCLEQHIKYKSTCPECNQSFKEATSDFRIKARVETFLENYPDKHRKDMTMDEIEDSKKRIGGKLQVRFSEGDARVNL